MSDNMDMNEVNSHLEDIDRMYTNETFSSRMRVLIRGFKAPRQSKEYKQAQIELQRLSAPIAAILLPAFLILLLAMMSGRGLIDDRIIETQVMEAEELKELLKIEEVKPPEQVQDIVMDIPITRPDMQVPNEAPNQPVSPQPQLFDAVMTVKSPMILKNIYGSTRNTGTRGVLIAQFGGTGTDEAVMRALRWLKKKQNSDGSWSQHKVGMTGLAILTFLAHNEKPGASAEFGATVQQALEFLLKAQNSNGRISTSYNHAIATYALCESYGMTLNPNVKSAAENAIRVIITGQNPAGGWCYALESTDDSDTSVMGWCAQALKAAKMARLNVEGLEPAIKRAIKGFKGNAQTSGGFGYRGPGQTGLTSVGTLCMQLLGASNEKEVKLSMEVMDAWVPSFDAHGGGGGCPQYYFYYATQAKFHEGGKRWDNWNKQMKPLYISEQKIEKNAIKDANGRDRDIGWWENKDSHSDRPVMDTCLAALQLMVYYRYLPTTSKVAVQIEDELKATTLDVEDIRVNIGTL